MSTRFKVFLLSIPLIVLLGSGVFVRSVKEAAPAIGCVADNLSGVVQEEVGAIFEGASVVVPRLASVATADQVLAAASPDERWIEVDLSEQKLRAWDGDTIFLETAVSSGLPGTPTPTGEFRVWVKLRATKMEGGQGRYYYYLPNVPFVMYFENDEVPGWRGYGLHGTYWHNDFGNPRSHGCVNLPTPVAEELYYWATPALPTDKSSVFAGPDNPGTRVIIHD
jgi:lipoprotein-anchoring transpeptidase ErfK/SrfK